MAAPRSTERMATSWSLYSLSSGGPVNFSQPAGSILPVELVESGRGRLKTLLLLGFLLMAAALLGGH